MKNHIRSFLSISIVLFSYSTWAVEEAIPSFEEATLIVKEALQKAEIATSKAYCTKGTMTCRTMYLLKDKVSGEPANIFYDTFYSADRQVGSTCYFIPTKSDPTKYFVFTDAVFDGKLEIGIISPFLATVTASPDRKNIVFGNLKSPKIGTTFYSLSSFTQDENRVLLEGTEFDSANPAHKADKRIEYFRIFP